MLRQPATRALIVLALTALGCHSGPDASSSTENLDLLPGRDVDVELPDENGDLVTTTVDLSQFVGEGPFADFFEAMGNACGSQAGERFGDLDANGSTTMGAGCAASSAEEQQRQLCIAYQLLDASTAQSPTDYFERFDENDDLESATIRHRSPGDAIDDPTLGTRVMTIPVLTGSDAASTARMAVLLASFATMKGAAAFNTEDGCEDGEMTWTIPSSGDQRVTLGFVIASQTNEAMHLLVEAGDTAERLLSAAAEARLADDPDRPHAITNMWRGRTDSRLEIADMWLGVPDNLFEADPDVQADGEALSSPSSGFPVVIHTAESPGAIIADQLLRSLLVVNAEAPEESLRAAYERDHPEVEIDIGMSTEDFLARLGTSIEEVQLASEGILEQAEVTHHQITFVDAGAGTPPHALGIQAQSTTALPVQLLAATTGQETLQADWPEHSVGFVREDPQAGGIVLVLDYAKGELLSQPGLRTDLSDDALRLIDLNVAAANTYVDGRIRVCVGAQESNIQNDVEITMYGMDGRDVEEIEDEFDLWVSDDGVLCAITGRLSTGEPCDPANYRIDADLALDDTVSASGLGERAAVWTFDGDSLPESEFWNTSGIPDTIPVYITQRHDGARRARAGFGIGAADGAARCTYTPLGPLTVRAIAAIAASAANPSQPADHCAGIEDTERLPIQDEIDASGTSSGIVEQVFLHYLQRAEEAAGRAEQLGERLISEEVEMDQIAEQAVQRLNAICGTHISATYIPLNSPATCMTDADCAGTTQCLHGVCHATTLADYLSFTTDADLTRVRRCLGDQEQTGLATLGRAPMCGWYLASGEVCGCPPGEDCTGTHCNVHPLDDGTCGEGETSVIGTLPGLSGAYVPYLSLPLALVPQGPATPAPELCRDLAILRAGHSPDGEAERLAWRFDLLRRLEAEPWFDQDGVGRTVEGVGFDEDLGNFARVTRGNRPWFGTGSMDAGPTASTTFPCGPHPILSESDVAALCAAQNETTQVGIPLVCGFGSCSDLDDRAAYSTRLQYALRELATIGGREVAINLLSTEPAWGATPVGSYVFHGSWLPLTTVEEFTVNLDGHAIPARCLSGAGAPAWPSGRCDSNEVSFLYPLHSGSSTGTIFSWWQTAQPSFVAGRGHGVTAILYDLAARTTFVGAETAIRGDGLMGTYGGGWNQVGHLLDALEIACIASQDDVGGCAADPSQPVHVSSVEDMARLEGMLRCTADRFDGLASELVFVDFPTVVAEDIRDETITGTYPSFGGEYGAEVAGLRGDMEDIVRAISQVSGALVQIANDVRLARSQVSSADLEAGIIAWQHQAAVLDNVFGCLAAASPYVGSGVSFNTGSIFVCVNALAQSLIDDQVTQLREEATETDVQQIQIGLAQTYGERVRQIADSTRLLGQSYASVNARLARMGALRQEAHEELAQMLFLSQDQVGQEMLMNSAMRGRMSRSRVQFEEAHRNAVRMAMLARLAIEQRIGMRLSSIDREMTLVPAPSGWVDRLCTLSGVDFGEVWRDPTTGGISTGSAGAVPNGLETVADYVARLRLFLDSYQIDFPFVNGRDTVVLSMASDILRPVRECSVSGYNVLRETEALDNVGAGASFAWVSECDEGDACVSIGDYSDVSAPVFRVRDLAADETGVSTVATRALGGGTAYTLRVSCDPADVEADCGGPLDTGGSYGQGVTLEEGHYVLSWYERCVDCESPRLQPVLTSLDALTGVPSFDAVMGETVTAAATADRWVNASDGWARWQSSFVVASDEGPRSLRVAFVFADDVEADEDGVLTADLAGPQLEAVVVGIADYYPRSYFPSDASGMAPVGLCADASAFRREWTYRCEAACPTGACPDGPGTQQCFWETRFSLNLSRIERGDLVPTGGFALGNFNYRTEELGLNVVGVGVRDCSEVTSSTTCYASGFAPFTLWHDGPYDVRNHVGDTLQVPVVPGRIVYAKALAAERLITNPVSGADRALLTDFMRTEFRGRPLDGRYTLRIYDTAGFRWDRVEDIQIVLNYEYWTRQVE